MSSATGMKRASPHQRYDHGQLKASVAQHGGGSLMIAQHAVDLARLRPWLYRRVISFLGRCSRRFLRENAALNKNKGILSIFGTLQSRPKVHLIRQSLAPLVSRSKPPTRTQRNMRFFKHGSKADKELPSDIALGMTQRSTAAGKSVPRQPSTLSMSSAAFGGRSMVNDAQLRKQPRAFKSYRFV
jgi:hypothetical protein